MEAVSEETFAELRRLFGEMKNLHDVKLGERTQESGDGTAQSAVPEAHFEGLINRLDEIISASPKEGDQHVKLLSMKSSLLYEQAKMLMSVDDLDGSQTILEKNLEIIEKYHDHYQITFLYMRVVNHLAYLLSKQGHFERSRDLLESISDAQEPTHDMLVYSTDELFSNEPIDQTHAKSKLNKLVANNLQMLGWIYGRLGMPGVHATKQHMALERQLQAGDCDLISWSCRCSRLAALYLSRCCWVSARYHLIVAELVLDGLQKDTPTHIDLPRAQAELARSWVNYGLHLFSNSKPDLIDRKYPGNYCTYTANENENETNQPEESAEPEELKFSGFDVSTDDIPAAPIRSTEGARQLFLHTHMWLKRARLYYTLRDFPIQYVNAVLDLSELYRFLAFYEADLDSQYNVQKRRADALETLSAVLREVRPQCYIAVSVELLRELAEVQIEMMGINLRRLHMAKDGIGDDEDSLKRKIAAIANIQTKLEGVGDMLGHANFKEGEVADEENAPSDNGCKADNCNEENR